MLNILWAIAAAFVVLWLVGFLLDTTLGGFIHVLLALALIAIVFRFVMGRSVA